MLHILVPAFQGSKLNIVNRLFQVLNRVSRENAQGANFVDPGKSREFPVSVIPAPDQVRDKLQPVEDSDLSENPVFSIGTETPGPRFSTG